MAKPQSRQRGFSLVELLVALVFTMVLMAGMANVYKASIGTFYTSGESLSNVRRNRMSVDLLGDDLNAACMYLKDLSIPPSVNAQSPPFYILPNMPIANPGPNDPATCDELYFYVDQPLAFEGTLTPGGAGGTIASMQVAGNDMPSAPPPLPANTYVIDCASSSTYAKQVKKGQYFIFKDAWEAGYIISDPVVSGTTVLVTCGPDPNTFTTGSGATGIPKEQHIPSQVVFMLPGQMVRYRIEILKLDPGNANGIPCLVRDQGTYSMAGFVANQPQQLISENVSGFKVYLSTNAGASWAGLGATYTGLSTGWDQGIRTEVDTQLTSSGRPDYQSTRGSEHWFREIPTLVRVDVSTRTATQRAEYSTTGNTLAYRNLTQSLVFVPRHAGLTQK